MKYMNLDRFDLQLFAEDPEELGPEETEDDEEDEDEEPEQDPKPKKKKERTYTKKELGAIVAKEVAKAKKKSEAERLEDLTEEEKSQKNTARMDELEKELSRMKLSKVAGKLLRENDVDPTDETLELVLTDDAETTKENIEKLVAFRTSVVEKTEEKRAKGKTPKVATSSGKQLSKEDLAKMDYKDVLAYKRKNPEAYKKAME